MSAEYVLKMAAPLLNCALFIPDVEADAETLVIRLSYNSQAILDDFYCRDKSELTKLIFDNSLTEYIPKTYSKYNDNDCKNTNNTFVEFLIYYMHYEKSYKTYKICFFPFVFI